MIEGQQYINDLTRRQQIKIEYLPGRTYTATAPSLLAQLRAAAGSSTSGRGGHTVPGSRLPVNTDTLDLWAGIVHNIHGWADTLHIDRRPYREPPLTIDGLGDFALPPTGRLLRAIYAQAIAVGWTAAVDRIGHRAGLWRARITNLFAGTTQAYPLRGRPCDDCGATEVLDQRDGEWYRTPAVQAQLAVMDDADHLWPYLTCLACGSNGWLPYRAGSADVELARWLAPAERIAA